MSTELIGGKNKPSKPTVLYTEQISGGCARVKTACWTWIEYDDILYTFSAYLKK